MYRVCVGSIYVSVCGSEGGFCMPTIDLDSCSLGYLGIGAGQLPDKQRRRVIGSGIRSDCRGVRVDVVGIVY